jgi:phosphatidylserine decarboxylase
VIRWFVGRYGVNMAEAANPDIASYASFNEFFTRPLKPGRRPAGGPPISSARSMARSASSAPSSATRSSRPRATVIRRPRWSAAMRAGPQFEDGDFATLYLSPKDYHRIHMPCAGACCA